MTRKLRQLLIFGVAVALLLTSTVFAGSGEDGLMTRRNISRTPDGETEEAGIAMMSFYVPAQAASGDLIDAIQYWEWDAVDEDGKPDRDAETYFERGVAKPLVSIYIDGIEHEDSTTEEEMSALGGASFGSRDAFAALSLDDGESWKTVDLSNSADLSSFVLANGLEYPGDVHYMTFGVAGDRVLAAWLSKYCGGGSPLYALWSDEADADEDGIPDEMELLQSTFTHLTPLYTDDIFGVAGSQGSVDYTLQGYPEVGEVPYSCAWTARGRLRPVLVDQHDAEGNIIGEPLPGFDIVWTKPERLTSGRRDANRIEIGAAEGAGFMMVWQEDPEGLRPGKGLGPGEGWSGAIVNAKTDIWYSYISWDDFDRVQILEDDPATVTVVEKEWRGQWETIKEYILEDPTGATTGAPKVAVPMAMPIRLSDNNMCKADPVVKTVDDVQQIVDPYCYTTFEDDGTYDWPGAFALAGTSDASSLEDYDPDACTDSVWWDKNGDGIQSTAPTDLNICVASDGRILWGRTGAARPRLTLMPYTQDIGPDGEEGTVDDVNSAWVVLAYEELKAMGDILLDSEGAVCEPTGTTSGGAPTYDDDCEPVDVGKNIWYHTFDMFDPDLVQQGLMINQPAQDPTADPATCAGSTQPLCPFPDPFPFPTTLLNFDIAGYEYEVYHSEIARRFNLMTQPASKLLDPEGNYAGTSGILIYKQGIFNQGGPADIFLRRLVLPIGFNPTIDNPYAYENLVCDERLYTDGSNPNYVHGLCMDDAINVSGTTIVGCDNGLSGDACAAEFPWDIVPEGDQPVEPPPDDTGTPTDLEPFPKVVEWRQCDDSGASLTGDGLTEFTCEETNLDDQSWKNPYDVSKGHRGFIDGDFIMMIYAWSPNWKANSVGNDHYNLYVRRSFDGGQTWTNTPESWDPGTPDDGIVADGSEFCEWYIDPDAGGPDAPQAGDKYTRVCFDYPASLEGTFEQARNVSELIGNRVTILDPRYSPTPGDVTECMAEDGTVGVCADSTVILSDLSARRDDIRDPSAFFIVYETGDNTTVTEGEAVPLDLFYSRAYNYGDEYDYIEYLDEDDKDRDGSNTDYYYVWDWLEHDRELLSGEASITSNPAGTFFYGVWNQWKEHEEDGHEVVTESDVWFRRVMYTDWIQPELVTTQGLPWSEILYVSTSAASFDEIVTFVGTARDGDHVGALPHEAITQYEWTSDIQGFLSSEKSFSMQAGQSPGERLWRGFHTIGFRAKDDEGNWSTYATTTILVAEQIFTTYMPMILR